MTELTKFRADVLIIGSGLTGAVVAQSVRENLPSASIIMIDSGPELAGGPGVHVHETEPAAPHDTVPAPSFYKGATVATEGNNGRPVPGMNSLGALGNDASQMPAAALAWNTGGMSVHWTGATPTPWGAEVPAYLDAWQWRADLAKAGKLLKVNLDPYGTSPALRTLRSALGSAYDKVSAPGRRVQAMPMAWTLTRNGGYRHVGPSTVFEAMVTAKDPRFTLLSSMLATSLDHDGQRVGGIFVRDLATGLADRLEARVTVICADAFRTPQLLYASGIRPAALGKFLNEHAILGGSVLADLHRLKLPADTMPRRPAGERYAALHWMPHSGPEQPFHGVFFDSAVAGAEGDFPSYRVGLSIYIPTESREENQLVFSDREQDSAGMPQIEVRFSLSGPDIALVNQARVAQERIAGHVGQFDPVKDSGLLPAGSSLHCTGTVRMGADDGTSVCDRRTRVWGYDNLFLAGCGVIPTSMACNVTLAAAVNAVIAAREAVTFLDAQN